MDDEQVRRLMGALRTSPEIGQRQDLALGQDVAPRHGAAQRPDAPHRRTAAPGENAAQGQSVGQVPNVGRDDLSAALIELFAGALDRVSAYARHVAEEAHLESVAQHPRVELIAKRRPRFFSGQVLRAEDLQAQQDYFRERLRLQNRIAFGTGVAFGLSVACSDTATGARVAVAPGCVVDPNGELVTLREETRVPAGLHLPAYVCIRYAERPCDPVPAESEGALEPTRIEESARVTIEVDLPEDGVALARLVKREGRTIVDPLFRPRKVGHARAR